MGSFEWCSFAGGSTLERVVFEIKRSMLYPFTLCFCACGSVCEPSASCVFYYDCCHACLPATVNSNPSGTVCQNKSSLPYVTLVVALYHNHRKVTTTPGWERSCNVVEKNPPAVSFGNGYFWSREAECCWPGAGIEDKTEGPAG